MLAPLDYVVLVGYLLGVAALGVAVRGRQDSATDYFLGGRDLPWWAVCFSVIATETSTLTVIGIPAVAYGGTLTFLQLTLGFLIGRIVVSVVLLPRYFRGGLVTAYALLGQRFGPSMQRTASVTFMGTRLLADGVRLFATAIPLKVVADAAGFSLSYAAIIAVIGLITVAYTFVGGLRAVVWVDVVQMMLYIGGALLAIGLLLQGMPEGAWQHAVDAGKTQLLDLSFADRDDAFSALLTSPYALPVAVLGGAVFTMASHGADHLIVQRLLACRTLSQGRRALIGSGVGVVVQFALFLAVGLLLWMHYGGASLTDLGLSRGDEVFPKFIVEEMPVGLAGLLLAGIVAAAMSTLSSSLNALASATVFDVLGRDPDDARTVTLSRFSTLGWGIVFIGFATLFESRDNPVVELGLGIASYTYGGLLGAFLLALISRHARQADALVAFLVTVATMTWVIFAVWYSPEVGWLVDLRPTPERRAELGLVGLAWPLYTVVGAALCVGVGTLLGRRHPQDAAVS
ncbi:MAG: sodium:solute symporter [Bacteroidota bacterium]